LTYNEVFTQIATDLSAAIRAGAEFTYGGVKYNVADRSSRSAAVERISGDYWALHAEFNQRRLDAWEAAGCKRERPLSVDPNDYVMTTLTDALLYEDLTDPNPHKVAHTEYPFLSERQLELRRDRETSLKQAEEQAVDGRDYRLPERRRRTRYENWHVDTHAKGRNKERRDRYARETAAGPVVTYNLRDTEEGRQPGEYAPEFTTRITYNCVPEYYR
jgi:hypothetical protein